jgi:hypothetical protein
MPIRQIPVSAFACFSSSGRRDRGSSFVEQKNQTKDADHDCSANENSQRKTIHE